MPLLHGEIAAGDSEQNQGTDDGWKPLFHIEGGIPSLLDDQKLTSVGGRGGGAPSRFCSERSQANRNYRIFQEMAMLES